MPAPIFDSAKQQGRLVGECRGAGIKNRMNWIGPVRGRQYRILGMAMKKRFEPVRFHAVCFVAASSSSVGNRNFGTKRVARGVVAVTLDEARISRSESKKHRVDSAP